MARSGILIEQVSIALRGWGGPAARVLSFHHHDPTADTLADLDVHLFQPTNEDLMRGVEPFAMLVTAGMCTRLLNGRVPLMELWLSVSGAHGEEQLRAMARALAELAAFPFRASDSFDPPMVLRNVDPPLFPNLSAALISDADTGEFLGGLEPPVRLVRVTPLFDEEAAVVVEIGDRAAIELFRDCGTDLEDPQRNPADVCR